MKYHCDSVVVGGNDTHRSSSPNASGNTVLKEGSFSLGFPDPPNSKQGLDKGTSVPVNYLEFPLIRIHVTSNAMCPTTDTFGHRRGIKNGHVW